MDNENNYHIKPIRIRLSLRTDYIFNPIDSDEFAKAIERNGFNLMNPPQTMGQIRLEMPGQLAEKENNNIILDTNRQILAVDGDNPDKIIEIFNEIENIIKNELHIDFSESIKFYEIIVDYQIQTQNNPREIIENAKKEDKLSELFSSILGQEVTPFTLRYASKGISPDSANYIDFRIEPFVRRANKIYTFNLVSRSEDGNEVKSLLQSITDKMEKIVACIETPYASMQ